MPKTRRPRTPVVVLLVALLSSNLAHRQPPLAEAASPARQIAMGVSMRPDRDFTQLDQFAASIGGRMPATWTVERLGRLHLAVSDTLRT